MHFPLHGGRRFRAPNSHVVQGSTVPTRYLYNWERFGISEWWEHRKLNKQNYPFQGKQNIVQGKKSNHQILTQLSYEYCLCNYNNVTTDYDVTILGTGGMGSGRAPSNAGGACSFIFLVEHWYITPNSEKQTC